MKNRFKFGHLGHSHKSHHSLNAFWRMFFSLFNGCYGLMDASFCSQKDFNIDIPNWHDTNLTNDDENTDGLVWNQIFKGWSNPWSLTARHLKNVGWTTTFLWGKEQLFRAYVKLHVFFCVFVRHIIIFQMGWLSKTSNPFKFYALKILGCHKIPLVFLQPRGFSLWPP